MNKMIAMMFLLLSSLVLANPTVNTETRFKPTDDDQIKAVVEVENASDVKAYDVKAKVVVKDQDGEVIEKESQTYQVLKPGATRVFSTDSFDPENHSTYSARAQVKAWFLNLEN